MARLFGTDGIRGVAGVDLTRELARRLGIAAVAVLGLHGEPRPSFIVGRDTRASGEWLEDALIDGIRSAGGDVIVAGVEPTPAVAFMTVDLGATSGVVISASHNPADDNGIKFFAANGAKLPDAIEDEIEAALAGPDTPADVPGSILAVGDAPERYLEHLVAAADGRLDGMRIVVDAANGAAYERSPELLRRLGATVVTINAEPDGGNINEGCGALHPDVVAREVVRVGADAGVCHDGDADRALFADADGRVLDGDHVLAAIALDMREAGTLVGGAVVTTPMANLGFLHAMREAGIDVVIADVGDRYVLEEMQRRGLVLGGEQSGHLILLDQATTGDGLLTAARMLSLAARTGGGIRALGDRIHKFPQVMENVHVSDREGLGGELTVWQAVADAESALGADGRILVRASGTEPLVRVMVEAPTEALARVHADAVASVVRSRLG